jgi:hypothetical protein
MLHVQIIQAGVKQWNQWRRENPSVLADLRGAKLSRLHLQGALLHDVALTGADLSFADLRDADLSRSDLRGAMLTHSDLRGADLRGTVLTDVHGGMGNTLVDITDADLSGTRFGWTILGDVYLNRITGIGSIQHFGPSYITTSTLELTAYEVAKTGAMRTDVELFLRGVGVPLESLEQFERSFNKGSFYSAFISYSHADKEFAIWFFEKLQGRGVRCWLDEKNMRPGERILDAVGRAISSHERVLLCCSRTSLESWWVQDEVRKAQELERQFDTQLRIIPILLDNHLLQGWTNGLAADLRSRLGVDFMNWRSGSNAHDGQIERIVEALKIEV